MGAVISSPIKDVYQVKDDTADVVMHTGDMNEVILKSYLIHGGTIKANGAIRIKATGMSTGNNGNKVYRLKLADITIATLTVGPSLANLHWTLFAAGHNMGAENSQNWSSLWIDEITIDVDGTGIGTGVNTSVNQALLITGQLANAADQCEIRDWTIEIRPAG